MGKVLRKLQAEKNCWTEVEIVMVHLHTYRCSLRWRTKGSSCLRRRRSAFEFQSWSVTRAEAPAAPFFSGRLLVKYSKAWAAALDHRKQSSFVFLRCTNTSTLLNIYHNDGGIIKNKLPCEKILNKIIIRVRVRATRAIFFREWLIARDEDKHNYFREQSRSSRIRISA